MNTWGFGFRATWKEASDLAYFNAHVGLEEFYILKNKGLERT